MKFLPLIYALLNYFLWSLGGLTQEGTAAEGVELVEFMAELQTQVGPRFIPPLCPCGHGVTPATAQAFGGS